ncbi:PREDICTED: uncharacterized protein LOC108367586, partial [Rhagoletis zephyria]|uniref:uncharacterized protein LOC108367586 n=1 Tax=Rhagoletis zephyria TaxID=28612 RepID=UPI000811A05F
DVKAVETQLEEYATQCLKDISDHFLQLHSFLQNEEHRILEEFHSQCLKPQQTIRDSFSKLGESQSILNKMRSELELYQHKVPTDIHLRNIFEIYNSQLEQIECRAQISKVTKNPFIFEVKYDFRKDFSKSFIYDYNDPQLKIRLASVYSDLNQTFRDIKSDSSDEMDVDCYIEKHKRKNNERNKKKKLALRRNDNEDEGSNTSDTEAKLPLLRDKELVRISHVKSPEHFFVQTKNAISVIRELSNKYVNFMQTDVIPKLIAEGQCYMIYHADDKQWYRAMVKKALSQDLYRVFLVDIGFHVEMPKDRFCEIDTKSLSIPFGAIRCAIHDIMPAGKTWNEEANNLLIEITRNHFVRISIIQRIKENVLSVDLITTSSEEAISVRDSFLYTGLAREMSGTADMPSPLKKISPVARTNQRLPKYNFHNGDILSVKVTHIESPHLFYVIKTDAIEAATILNSDLNYKYLHLKMPLQPLFVAPLQMGCAVRIDGVWHRARIEEILIRINYLYNFSSQFQFKHFKPEPPDHDDDIKEEINAFDEDDGDNDDTVNDCLDQLLYNLDHDNIHSDSDASANDELNNALSPMQAAQAAQLAMKQQQYPHQQTFVPPCKKRMFDSNEYKQLHKQMLHENLYGSENFIQNELAAIMQSDNDVGDVGAGATGWGLGDDDDDAAIVELEQSFALNYWHNTDDEVEREKAKEKIREKEMAKEQQRTRDKVKGREMEILDSASFALRPRQNLDTSAFDKFYPNETSSVFSHFSGIESFKNPQLPVGKRTFECSVACIVTPTIVQILPHLTEFEYRELELERRIKHLVKSAPYLTDFEPRTICLAVYHKDRKWYRALIRSHNPVAKQVDVLYVDYLNTASVLTTNLRQCPLELISWPLRTIRARLHGLVPNPRLREKDIRQALQDVLLKRTLIARIVKDPKCLESSAVFNMSDLMGPEDIDVAGAATGGAGAHQQDSTGIMEVHLYGGDNKSPKNARVYEMLIQESFYSYKST